MSTRRTRLGILGGGQLGRMLIQASLDFDVDVRVLDPDPSAPCARWSGFSQGKLSDHDTVVRFGSACDVVTIEIENVNTEALLQLQKKGVKVFPEPHVIARIQDKGAQKLFYREMGIATAAFALVTDRADVRKRKDPLPMILKLRREGYDGRGVMVIRTEADRANAFDAPGIVEPLVAIEKEISVIVARDQMGRVAHYPAVGMSFHPDQNLVEYLFSPAGIPPETEEKARSLAVETITRLGMTGLLAVEMFVTQSGEVLVNEVAPRPHNSGHHTIEANFTSQYHQLLRVLLNLPLGDPQPRTPSVMINLLGEAGHSGPARYQGLDEVLAIPGAYVHLYGKRETRPFRKMGHVTIVGKDVESLRQSATFVKQTLKVIT